MKTSRLVIPLTWLVFASPLAGVSRGAPIIWNDVPITFSKTTLADWTLPENQDRLTDNVWLTRSSNQGLFNIKTESFFTHLLSPAGTEWAFGTTADFASLTYTDWETWTGGPPLGPPATVGRDAVVHLIADDVYVDIKILAWGIGDGSFSYTRATAPTPEPGSLALLGVGALAASLRRRQYSPRIP